MRYGDFVILTILPKMTITKVTLQVAKQFFFQFQKYILIFHTNPQWNPVEIFKFYF